MGIDSFSRVDREARRLLDKLGMTVPPIDVEQIAKALNLELIYQTFNDDLSGVLVKSDGRNAVGINSKHPRTRQRFSLAHEIGHFWLSHPGDMFVNKTTAAVFFRDGRAGDGTSVYEMEANRFAASLLMPAHLVIESFLSSEKEAQGKMDRQVNRLAREYEVSSQAMQIRLSSLGVLAAA